VPVSSYGSVLDPNVIESAVVITNTYTLSETNTKRLSLPLLTSVTATNYDTTIVTATVLFSVGLPGAAPPHLSGDTQTVSDQASSPVSSSTLEIPQSTAPLDLSKSLDMTILGQNTFSNDLDSTLSQTWLPTDSFETTSTQGALFTGTIEATSSGDVSPILSAATSIQPVVSASAFSNITMSNVSGSLLNQPVLSSSSIGTSSLGGAFTTDFGTATSIQSMASTDLLPGASSISLSSDVSSQLLFSSTEAPTSSYRSSLTIGLDTSAPNLPEPTFGTTSTSSLITTPTTDTSSQTSLLHVSFGGINLTSSAQDSLSASTTAPLIDTIATTSAPVASSMEITSPLTVRDSSISSQTLLATNNSTGISFLAKSKTDNTPASSMQDGFLSSHPLLVTDTTTELSPSATSSSMVSSGSAISVNTSPTSVSAMDTAISPSSLDATQSIHITTMPPSSGSPLTPSTILVTVAPSIVVSGVCDTILLGSEILIPGAAPVTTESHTISLGASNLLIVDETKFHLCDTLTDSNLITSTMTTLPPGFSVEDNTAITANGWLTTADSQGVPTVLPVLACPHCGGGHGGLILWKLPELSHIKFKFSIPTISKLPSISLPCIKILGLKVAGNCDPVSDNNDDHSNDQSSTTTDSTTTTLHADVSTRPDWTTTASSTTVSSASSQCTSFQTASHCLEFGSAFSTSGTTTTIYYSTNCSTTITGCTPVGTTSTTISTSSQCEMTYPPLSTMDFAPATPIARKHKRVTETTQACGRCQTNTPAPAPAITATAFDDNDWGSEEPDSIPRRWLAGKAYSSHLLERRKQRPTTILSLGLDGSSCPLDALVTKPAYRGAKEYLKAELPGILYPPEFSSISRWYSHTSIGACVPTLTKVNAQQIDAATKLDAARAEAGLPNDGADGEPSMDHACKF
jgi:hypothetical protein